MSVTKYYLFGHVTLLEFLMMPVRVRLKKIF